MRLHFGSRVGPRTWHAVALAGTVALLAVDYAQPTRTGSERADACLHIGQPSLRAPVLQPVHAVACYTRSQP